MRAAVPSSSHPALSAALLVGASFAALSGCGAHVPIRPTAPRAREFRRLTRESSPWLARPTLLPARAPMPPSTLPA
jgi:hypothetical protein